MTSAQTAEDRIAFLRRLRAVRRFRPDPVPQAVVDDLLEVARWTGSARNLQPWELVVIRDRERLRALAEVRGYAGHLADASLGIVLVMAGEREEQETYDEGRLSERIMLAALWRTGSARASDGWLGTGGRLPRRSWASPLSAWCAPRSPWVTRTKRPGARDPGRHANPSPKSFTRSATIRTLVQPP